MIFCLQGSWKWRITKMFLNFHKGGDHFSRIYTHIEYIRWADSLGSKVHSSKKKFSKKKFLKGILKNEK